MNRQTVLEIFKAAGLNNHQAEQVGYLYTQFGALKFASEEGYVFKNADYLKHDTIRRAAANPMFSNNPNW